MDKISKRAAFLADQPPSSSNSLIDDATGCVQTDVVISRPCTYEECVETKYPYHG